MGNKRISELQIEVNPKISDLVALASDGQSKRTTLGSILNSDLTTTFGDTIINGDLTVNGTETIVSSSVLYDSGSTIFGDSVDDEHDFIGDVTISGSLFVSGGTEFGGDIFPQTPQGATLGTIDKPFRELFLQSGSISIESDTPGDPSAIISNNNGNLDISVGGMRLVQPGNSFIAETGSFQFISGSLTQIGDYTRFGDTITIGDFETTGSLSVSGSTIQIGDNTLIGKTSLTGSVNISGSLTIIGEIEHTGSIYISGSIQSPEWIDFKLDNGVTPQMGRVWWDSEDITLNAGLDNDVVLQMGQEVHYPKVVNKDSVTIPNGSLVMIRPTDITQGQRLAVQRWDGTQGYPSDYIIGVATHDILKNEEGYVTWFGYVRGISISALESAGVKDAGETWEEGQILYPHPTLRGGLTNVTPTSPNVKSTIAVTTALNGNNLTILVRPKLGQKFNELYDVDFDSAVEGSMVYKSGSQGEWGTTESSLLIQPPYVVLTEVSESLDFANDGLAAAGGVPLGGLYRNGNVIQIRIV